MVSQTPRVKRDRNENDDRKIILITLKQSGSLTEKVAADLRHSHSQKIGILIIITVTVIIISMPGQKLVCQKRLIGFI